MSWTRTGELTKLDPNDQQKHVIYINNSNSPVVRQLEVYASGRNVGMAVTLCDLGSLDKFVDAVPKNLGRPVMMSQTRLRAGIESDNPAAIKEFLLTLHNIDKLDASSLRELSAYFKIDCKKELAVLKTLSAAEVEAIQRQIQDNHAKIQELESQAAQLKQKNLDLEARLTESGHAAQHARSSPALFRMK